MDDETLQDWVTTGRARIAPGDLIEGFGEFLQRQTWTKAGAYLDWSRYPHSTANLSRLSARDLVGWIRATRAGSHSMLLLVRGFSVPSLVMEVADAARNLDVVYRRRPGPQHMCGADHDGGRLGAAYADLIEYNGADRLTATV